jgi:hypothetical protein
MRYCVSAASGLFEMIEITLPQSKLAPAGTTDQHIDINFIQQYLIVILTLHVVQRVNCEQGYTIFIHQAQFYA